MDNVKINSPLSNCIWSDWFPTLLCQSQETEWRIQERQYLELDWPNHQQPVLSHKHNKVDQGFFSLSLFFNLERIYSLFSHLQILSKYIWTNICSMISSASSMGNQISHQILMTWYLIKLLFLLFDRNKKLIFFQI